MKLGQNMTLAYVRGSRQFGGLLKDSHVNCGIGKFLDIFKPGSTGTTLMPNRFLEKPREFVNLAGNIHACKGYLKCYVKLSKGNISKHNHLSICIKQ